MNVSNLAQKQERLKRFLELLSQDASLNRLNESGSAWSWDELLSWAGYVPRNGTIDLAELVSRTLRKTGIDADTNAMMDYILNGGTVDEFISEYDRE
ncbi:hypothetical protein ACF3MZ_00655 [Paenibacillaceae bacterium WGS1546]|uniref:hypothetical protein n=1 Tax=Cohnella sp. WGS1546 TaxID=3366810 RepID=UPI00372D7163